MNRRSQSGTLNTMWGYVAESVNKVNNRCSHSFRDFGLKVRIRRGISECIVVATVGLRAQCEDTSRS